MPRRKIGWFFLGAGGFGALALLLARNFLTDFAAGNIAIESSNLVLGYVGIGLAIAIGGFVMYPIAAVVVVGAAVYGPMIAIATYPASLVGAAAGWWLGQRMGQDAFQRYPGETARKLLDIVERRAMLSAALVRWIPGLPFALQNVGLGAARVPFSAFLIGSMLGIFPAQASQIVGGVTARELLRQLQGSLVIGWVGVGVAALAGIILLWPKNTTSRQDNQEQTS